MYDVYFEYSSDMTAWTYLGQGIRINGGWEITGQTLPFNEIGYIRGRGKAFVAFYGSTSQIESVRQYYNMEYSLTVNKAGTGTGRVISNPSGIDYGAVSTAGFPAGTVVTLRAEANASSSFTGWSGDAAGTGDSCSVAMSADKAVTAGFTINTYTITATAGSGGTISPNGPVLVNHGEGRIFTITANTGYHIANVLVDGSSAGAVGSYQFTNITGHHTISAAFAVDTSTPAGLQGNIDTTSPGSANLVDGHDLYIFSKVFGANSASPNWNPAADFDASGTVDGADLVILGANFGKSL